MNPYAAPSITPAMLFFDNGLFQSGRVYVCRQEEKTGDINIKKRKDKEFVFHMPSFTAMGYYYTINGDRRKLKKIGIFSA